MRYVCLCDSTGVFAGDHVKRIADPCAVKPAPVGLQEAGFRPGCGKKDRPGPVDGLNDLPGERLAGTIHFIAGFERRRHGAEHPGGFGIDDPQMNFFLFPVGNDFAE